MRHTRASRDGIHLAPEPAERADLPVMNGDPSRDVSLFRNLDNLRVIMREGVVYKNTLASERGPIATTPS